MTVRSRPRPRAAYGGRRARWRRSGPECRTRGFPWSWLLLCRMVSSVCSAGPTASARRWSRRPRASSVANPSIGWSHIVRKRSSHSSASRKGDASTTRAARPGRPRGREPVLAEDPQMLGHRRLGYAELARITSVISPELISPSASNCRIRRLVGSPRMSNACTASLFIHDLYKSRVTCGLARPAPP